MLPLLRIHTPTRAVLDDPRAPDDIYLRIATDLDCAAIVALAGSNAAARAAMQEPGFWEALARAKGFALDPDGAGSALRRFFDACRTRERDLAERRATRVAALQTALLARRFADADALLTELDDGAPIELRTDALVAGLTPSQLALRLLARLPAGYSLPEAVIDRAIARLVAAGRDDNAREAAVVYEVATRLADRDRVLRRWLGRRLTTEVRAALVRAFGDERLDVPGDEDYALRDAVVAGDVKGLRRLVRRGEQPIDADLVALALRMRRIDVVRAVVDLVPMLEVTSTILFAALRAGPEALQLVLDKDEAYAPAPSVLLSAIAEGDADMLKALFERVPDKAGAAQIARGMLALKRRGRHSPEMVRALEGLLSD